MFASRIGFDFCRVIYYNKSSVEITAVLVKLVNPLCFQVIPLIPPGFLADSIMPVAIPCLKNHSKKSATPKTKSEKEHDYSFHFVFLSEYKSAQRHRHKPRVLYG